ncbi:MAG: PilN domain-containing protein [Pseudomonas sp.]
MVLLAAVVVLLLEHWGRQAQHRQLLEGASIRQAIEVVDLQLAQLEQYNAERAQVEQQLQVLGHLQGRRWLTVERLEQLERATPHGIYLTGMNQQGARLHIQGVAQSSALVAQLLRNLSSAIGEAEMQHIKAEDEGEAFELSVALEGEA